VQLFIKMFHGKEFTLEDKETPHITWRKIANNTI